MAEIAQMIAADRSEPAPLSRAFPSTLLRIEGAAMSELKLITPRRNFLVRALGFTAAGVGLVAFDHRSGFSVLKKLKILRMNQPHRSPCSKRQRLTHPHPLGLRLWVLRVKISLDARNSNVCFNPMN